MSATSHWESVHDFPEIIEANLDGPMLPSAIAFHPFGRTMVTGDARGNIYLYDMNVRSITYYLSPFDDSALKRASIRGLEWSPLGSRLAVLAENIGVRMLQMNEHGLRWKGDWILGDWTALMFHPLDHTQLLLSGGSQSKPVIYRLDEPPSQSDSHTPLVSSDAFRLSSVSESELSLAAWSADGQYVFLCESGSIYRISTQGDKQLLWTAAGIGSGSSQYFRELRVRSSYLLVNCSDKALRGFPLVHAATKTVDAMVHGPTFKWNAMETDVVVHKYVESLSKAMWRTCQLSQDGQFVLAGSGNREIHQVYIWESCSGHLVKILVGPKEPLLTFSLSPVTESSLLETTESTEGLGPVLARGILKMNTLPTASMMLSVSPSSSLVWRPGRKSSGLGLTPDFEELEENVEYEEAEDEFDLPLQATTISVTQARMKAEHSIKIKEIFDGLFQMNRESEQETFDTNDWPIHLRSLSKVCLETPVQILPIRSLSEA